MGHPIRYKNLTEEEIAALCNGCGKKGGFIPVPEFKFTASCNHHDFNYWLGCSEAHRIKADFQFLTAMLHDAEYKESGKRRNIISRNYYRSLAHIYYYAVRICGSNPVLGGFHYSNKQRDSDDLAQYMKEYMEGTINERARD